MAEYLSIGPVDPNTAMWLRDAARPLDEADPKAKKGRVDSLPAIKELDNGKYFPYRWGQAFWAYVGGRCGDGVIRADADDGGGGAATPTWRSNRCSAHDAGAVRRLAGAIRTRLSAGARGRRCRRARSAAR